MPWFRDHSNTTTTSTNTNTTMSSSVPITRTPSTSTSTSFEDNPRTDLPPDSIDTNRSRTSFITLEVYYSRGKDGFKSAAPYLREPILIDFHAPNPLTFRSFLRQSIFGIRPELKYKDEDVILYQTSKGTNLLTLMDAPIDALPDLVSSSEQLLLKVIVKADRKKKYNVLMDHKLSYKDPNGYIPKWPRTRLDKQNGIPEESSVHSWKTRPFTLDDWKVPKKRRRMLIIIMVVIALIAGITTPVCLILLPKTSSEKGRNPSSPTDPNAPTSSPVAPPSVFVKLKGIISAAGISNDFKDPDSIHYYALDWLAYDDAADLGSNLCSDQDDGSNASNDDLNYYYFYNRKRKLAECNANERVVRRYSLAVFYLATADLPPPDPDRRGLTRGQGSKSHWRRRVEWIDQLNFLSGTHECSWQRNDSGSDNIDDIQGVICRSEDNGDIILDESSTNSTIGEIVLNINEPNRLLGELESSIFHVRDLIELDIGKNKMNGEISIDEDSESFLEKLNVNLNSFTGNIDFLSKLPYLTEARLDNNMFQGTIPIVIGQMTNLRVLTLHGNSLTGTMPDEICALQSDYELKTLEADCDGSNPKVACSCCTKCY